MRELRTRNHVLSKATQQLLSELEFKPCMSELQVSVISMFWMPGLGLGTYFHVLSHPEVSPTLRQELVVVHLHVSSTWHAE